MNKTLSRPGWLSDFLVVLSFIFLFVTGAGVGVLYFNKNFDEEKVVLEDQIDNLEAQIQEMTAINTGKWKTYKSPYLFDFKYPRNWLVDSVNKDHLLFKEEKTNKTLARFDLILDQVDNERDTSAQSFSDFGVNQARAYCDSGKLYVKIKCFNVQRNKKISSRKGLEIMEIYFDRLENSKNRDINTAFGPVYVVDVSKYTSESRIFLIMSMDNKSYKYILKNIARSVEF